MKLLSLFYSIIALTKIVVCYKVKRSVSLSLSLSLSLSFPLSFPHYPFFSLSFSFSFSLSLSYRTGRLQLAAINIRLQPRITWAVYQLVVEFLVLNQSINYILPACTVYQTNYVHFWIQYTHTVHTSTHALRTRQSRCVCM